VPPVANYAAHWWPYFIGTTAFHARDARYALRRWLDVRFGGKAKPNQARHGDNPAEAD
jgi:hypothetical protein